MSRLFSFVLGTKYDAVVLLLPNVSTPKYRNLCSYLNALIVGSLRPPGLGPSSCLSTLLLCDSIVEPTFSEISTEEGYGADRA